VGPRRSTRFRFAALFRAVANAAWSVCVCASVRAPQTRPTARRKENARQHICEHALVCILFRRVLLHIGIRVHVYIWTYSSLGDMATFMCIHINVAVHT